MHTHIFYFLFFGGLGPAQPIWAGLDQPARLGHWLKPVTRLGEARVNLFTRAWAQCEGN